MVWFKKNSKLTSGNAVGKTKTASAPLKDLSEGEFPSTSIIATEATAQEESVTSTPLQSPTTFANITISNSLTNMEWSDNLQRVAEQSWEDLRSLNLDKLEPLAKTHLLEISEGTGEPPASIIWGIASYLVEAESEYCEGPLIDGVNYYLINSKV